MNPRSRAVLAVAGLGAVTVLVLAVLLAQPTLAPSPTPSAAILTGPGVSSPPGTSASRPTVVASSTLPPAAAAAYGLISRQGTDPQSPMIIRTESDATPLRSVPSFGLVPDGSRVAYWLENAGGTELHTLELGGGNDRIIAKFPERRGIGIAWSTDGTGVLVSLDEARHPQFFIARVLVAVDIASGTTREVYRGIGPSGASVIPLVWRRSPEIFAAYETGPGGYHFGYTVIRPGQAPMRTDPDGQVIDMSASSDGAFISGQWLGAPGERALKVWPVDNFSDKSELKLAAPELVNSLARWWPGRHEVVFVAGRLADGVWSNTRIERWDPATDARAVLKRFPDGATVGPYFIRADGSGLVTRVSQGRLSAWEVTDLRSGSTNTIPQLQDEAILESVLLR
jgi:hypothetical protein